MAAQTNAPGKLYHRLVYSYQTASFGPPQNGLNCGTKTTTKIIKLFINN